MGRHQLTLDDLVRGIEFFGDRYDALDVFARDLQEIARPLLHGQLGELRPVEGEPAFVFERGGDRYKLRIHPAGIARLTRAIDEPIGPPDTPLALEVLGAAFGPTSLDPALPSAVIGFLVGGMIVEGVDDLRRVFTMSHDASTGEWGPHDGSLLGFVREKRREVDAELRAAAG